MLAGHREGISVLADRGRRISLADVARLAVKMGWDYLIVDGVHVPTVTFGRKTGGQRAFYSGKHKRHGLNVQTVAEAGGARRGGGAISTAKKNVKGRHHRPGQDPG